MQNIEKLFLEREVNRRHYAIPTITPTLYRIRSVFAYQKPHIDVAYLLISILSTVRL